MKIACNREKLLSAFQIVATVVPTRSPKAVLKNVKMDAMVDQITLIATDMEVAMRIDVPDQPADVPGSVLLSVTQFGSILRESTDETLLIESDGRAVTVKGQRSKFRLPTTDTDEFPMVSEFSETDFYVVSARLFRELIRRTLFATDTESTRYALGGVLLEFGDETITAIGTDGRRLAKMEGPLGREGEPGTGDAMTIVPSRSMQLIERTLLDLEAVVHLAVHGNDFIVRLPSATIITRLVEGRFPNWRDALPHRSDAAEIELTVGPVYSAIKQAAIVANTEKRGIDFTFGNGLLVLSGLTADVGESRVDLPIDYTGDEIVLCLDHRFISDFLRVLDPDKVFTLNIINSESAALFETTDGYGYVVMPLAREQNVRATAGASRPA